MDISLQEIEALIRIIKERSDYDFTEYNYLSLSRRFSRILESSNITVEQLIHNLGQDSNFLEFIIKEITITTTELFRDPDVWKLIESEVVPSICDKPNITIWHAGCSKGLEVYSMLILLNEEQALAKSSAFGTDLNMDVLNQARNGVYKYRFNKSYIQNFSAVFHGNNSDIPCSQFKKYFRIDEIHDELIIRSFLREKAFFQKHDLVKLRTFTSEKFDVILCRNVIIYFNERLQSRIFNFFMDLLNPGGFLILGSHETILNSTFDQYRINEFLYRK